MCSSALQIAGAKSEHFLPYRQSLHIIAGSFSHMRACAIRIMTLLKDVLHFVTADRAPSALLKWRNLGLSLEYFRFY
jgi:hypothetical protein